MASRALTPRGGFLARLRTHAAGHKESVEDAPKRRRRIREDDPLRSLDPAPRLFESGRKGLPTFAQGGSGNSPRMISAVPYHTFDIAGENEPNRRATRVCAASLEATRTHARTRDSEQLRGPSCSSSAAPNEAG